MTESADESSGGDPPPAACAELPDAPTCARFEPPEALYEPAGFTIPGTELELVEVCPCTVAAIGTGGLDNLEHIIVEHPAGWPQDPASAPLVVFTHGNNAQFAVNYDFSALAAAGFVVLNVEPEGGSDGLGLVALACGLEYSRGTFAFADAVDCNTIVAGHSAGGGDAATIIADRGSEPWSHYFVPDGPLALRGGFMFATAGEFDPPLPAGGALPMLTLASATDADVNGGTSPIARHDQAPLEADFSANEIGRALVYTWGTDHTAFGGSGSIATQAGQGVVSGYVPAFAAATVYGDVQSVATWWSYLTRESYPDTVLDPDAWAHNLDFTLQSSVHCAHVPLGACEETPGCEVQLAECVQIDCEEVAALDCPGTPGCVLSAEDACMHVPRLRTSYTVDQTYGGTRLPVVEFFEDQSEPDHRPPNLEIDVDDAADVIAGIAFANDGAPTGHDTSLLLVEWGGSLGDEGEVYLDLPDGLDLANYSHLSLRVGNVLDKTTGINIACAVTSTDAVSFELALREQVGANTVAQGAFTSTGRIVQNDYRYLTAGQGAQCRGQQTMTTIRFPLAPFCAGVGATAANQLVLRFPETTDASRVLIDTIELTASPLDTPAECGMFAAAWHCEIDELVVTETACDGEPTPTCDTGDVTTSPLLAPLVEPVGDDDYRGWYVQTPVGAIVDPEDPTDAELDHVLARCISACELEYAANPDVAANCSAADAFLPPVFATYDARASHYDIPETYVHGAGAFGRESLECDLRTDCCEAFDEDLCATRLARVTEAGEGSGRGEEWSYGVNGVLIIDSPAMAEPVVGDLSGSMGGSLCAGGNATEACPIYIGSAEIELLDGVTVALSCDGQTVTHTLDSLELSLAQPAFGIQSHEYPQWSAIPAGGMVFDAHTVVDDTLEFDTSLPIDECVGLMFNAGWATVPMYGSFAVTFDLPCNGEIVDLEASFALTATSWLGSPPSGTITVPSMVTCPSTVSLTVSTSDTEYDVESVRWRVDDVLLDDAVTSIPFTQGHELTAVIRDSRGATRTVRKQVDCT